MHIHIRQTNISNTNDAGTPTETTIVNAPESTADTAQTTANENTSTETNALDTTTSSDTQTDTTDNNKSTTTTSSDTQTSTSQTDTSTTNATSSQTTTSSTTRTSTSETTTSSNSSKTTETTTTPTPTSTSTSTSSDTLASSSNTDISTASTDVLSTSTDTLSTTGDGLAQITPVPTPTAQFETISGSVFTLSQVVITVSGTLLTTVTPVPTSLSSPPPPLSASKRTAIIAGSTLGAIGLIVLILLIVFFRHKHRKLGFLANLSKKRQEQVHARSRLLEGEDMDDDTGVPMSTRYRDISERSVHSESPRLFRERGSETGSIFQEHVWPPPDPLVDPFRSSVPDLTSIVTNVMGPGKTDDRVASPGPLMVLNRSDSQVSQDSLIDDSDPTALKPPPQLTSATKQTSPLVADAASTHSSASQAAWINRSPRKHDKHPS